MGYWKGLYKNIVLCMKNRIVHGGLTWIVSSLLVGIYISLTLGLIWSLISGILFASYVEYKDLEELGRL